MKSTTLRRLQLLLGILIGCALSAGLLALPGSEAGNSLAVPRRMQLNEDCEGSLDQLVIHYTVEAEEIVIPVYRAFLAQLSGDVTVFVLCPDEHAFDHFVTHLGRVPCRLVPVVVDHAITCWSRDRWLSLSSVADRFRNTLLHPQGEMGAEVWPGRAGDQQVADDLTTRYDRISAVRSNLYFDGGDFVADSDTVFATPAVLQRNLHRTVDSQDALREQLESQLGRNVVLLKDAPDHHAGMFMMPVGDRTMLVGDPVQGKRLWDEMNDAERRRIGLPGQPDFSEATVHQFEAVAGSCREAGYRVAPMPTVVSDDGRTYLTYVNAILDHRRDERIVYLPVYSGADLLNAQAARVWADLGYEVQPVDCTSCYRHFGTLRCLVNVIHRDCLGACCDAIAEEERLIVPATPFPGPTGKTVTTTSGWIR
jgi:hypothetical protein